MIGDVGLKVSRKDLYQEPLPDGTVTDSEPIVQFEFETVNDTVEEQPETDGFQLFGGVTVSNDIIEPIAQDLSENTSNRPLEFYIYQSSPVSHSRALETAVSGAEILANAEKLLRACVSTTPDINKDWKPPKKRCRPGKDARKSRKIRKQRKQEAAEQDRFRFKPRVKANFRSGPSFHSNHRAKAKNNSRS